MIINTGGDSHRNKGPKLLWTNPDVDTGTLNAMSSLSLEIDFTDYDMLYIVTALSTTVDFIKTDVIMPYVAPKQTIGYNNGANTYARTVTITNTELNIGSPYKMANASPSTVDNKYVIPMYIYGY